MSAFKRSRLTKIVTFRVSEEEWELLDTEARRRNIVVADLIREALDAKFSPPAPAAPAARQKRKRPSGSAGSNA